MLPAIIIGTGAAVVAVSPAVLSGIVSLYTANAVLRTTVKAAEYAQADSLNAAIELIADRLQVPATGKSIATVMADVDAKLKDDASTGLAQIIQDKESGINALSLSIDNSTKDFDDISKAYWSAGPEE
jgi:hypothetical protein